MKNRIKYYATVTIVMLSMMSGIFFVIYKEYQKTFTREERIIRYANTSERQLTRTIYKALKAESERKVEDLALEIREKLIVEYADKPEKYIEDYDVIKGDSFLVETIDSVINNKRNRFFYVENDANDMFAITMNGIISDKSDDCSTEGEERNFEKEIDMHYNKKLASQALEALVSGKKEHIFWQFPNTVKLEQEILEMDIEQVLNLEINELRDFEFLVVSYIDRYGDILETTSVSNIGHKQDAKKIGIVQGFNLYDHIDKRFYEGYMKIEKNKKFELQILIENRGELTTKLVLVLLIIFISFFALAGWQNSYIKGCGPENDR